MINIPGADHFPKMDRFVVRQERNRDDDGSCASTSASKETEKKKRKIADEGRKVQESWEMDFFVTDSHNKPMCLICKEVLAVPKRFNVQRHYETRHQSYEQKFPSGSILRKHQIASLKKDLAQQKNVMNMAMSEAEAVTLASFHIAYLLAKNGKPFSDGELVKECFLASCSILFSDFKNKEDILRRIRNLQLSRNTITRRILDISGDLFQTLLQKVKEAEAFSIALDESKDNRDVAQLCLWVRCVDGHLNVTEDFFELIGLHGRTQGVDFLKAVKDFFSSHSVPLTKLVSVTTDGCPSMVGANRGFTALLRAEVPNLLGVHCIIHQEALCAKLGKEDRMKSIMSKVISIVNFIRARPLHHRQFIELLQEIDSEYNDLVLHTEVRWLSRGKVLQRFIALLTPIRTFLNQCSNTQPELEDEQWLLDLGMLGDVTCQLNKLNLSLQGKNQLLPSMVRNIKKFMAQLQLMHDQLQAKDFTHFPHLKDILSNSSDACQEEFDPSEYAAIIQDLKVRFENQFSSLANLTPFLSLLTNPFEFDISNSGTICEKMGLEKREFEEELLTVQSMDDNIISRLMKENIPQLWKSLPGSALHHFAANMMSIFGSTYTCEHTFSVMGFIKNQKRNRLTDENLSAELRCSCSSLSPNLKKLAENMVAQKSH